MISENTKMDVDYSDYSDSDYEASRSSVAKIPGDNSAARSSDNNKETPPVMSRGDQSSNVQPKTDSEFHESDSDAPPKKIKKPNSPLNNTPLLNLFLTSPHAERTATPPSSPAMMFSSNSSPPLPPRTPTPPPSRAPIIVTSKNVATAIAMAIEQTGVSKSGNGKNEMNGSTDSMSLENLNLNPLLPNVSQASGSASSQSNNSSGMKSVIVRAGPSTQTTVCIFLIYFFPVIFIARLCELLASFFSCLLKHLMYW